MKKFIETLRNIWRIEDLRKRILTTLGLILIYRLGAHVVLPGIDPTQLANLQNQAGKGVLSLLDMFSGGAFSRASVFGLGIMPYISASIVVQLLGIALTAGTMFVMWLGERITDKGIGNGISLIIMIGIIARLPGSLVAEIISRGTGQAGGLIMLLLEFVILFVIFMISIALVQAVRRIPVQYAKRVVGNRQYGGVRQYIPLKVNAAGVMPIIFAQALMFVPMMFTGFKGEGEIGKFALAFADYTGFWYNFVFALMIILFTYFYTAVTVNPQQMAEDMKRNGGFIPGVKPGKRTAEFIDNIMSRITLPGSLFLAFVAIMPAFAMLAGVNNQFAQFFGGTSLLILVGVVLDTLQQIESHLLMRHYDGLTKSGRIKGRGQTVAAL